MTAEHLRPKSRRLGVLEGDDIGHEIVPAAVRVAEAAAAQTGLAIAWTSVPIGRRALASHGHTLPDGTLETLGALDGWILGPIGHRAYTNMPQENGRAQCRERV